MSLRPRLLHPELDVALDARAPLEGLGVEQDLGLEVLIGAMAADDATVAKVASRVLLDPLTDPAAIRYRQEVLRACFDRPEVVRALHTVATRTLARRQKMYWGLVRRADAIVYHGGALLHLYQGAFRELRAIADAYAEETDAGPDGAASPPAGAARPPDDPAATRNGTSAPSDGLATFLASLRRDLHDDFLAEVDGHLRLLRFQAGVRVSARVGAGNAGTGYVLERPAARRPPLGAALLRWLPGRGREEAPPLTYRLPPHDDAGVRALAELQGRGLGRAADAIAAACDDLLWFFRQLQGETAYYVGALRLRERLEAAGAPTCLPEPGPVATGAFGAEGLVDAGLALALGAGVVGNDLEADGVDLVVVTGANQGGKTTFARSVGLAQLMMQGGLFVTASAFRAAVAPGVFTHFTREEDAEMRRGRLEDELMRLDGLVPALAPGSLLLMNESFASTNEREGSELATGIVRALTEAGVRVLFVTHLGEFARTLHDRQPAGARFLRAERLADGTRTFRMVEGAPERTSHGADLYRSVFEQATEVLGPGGGP